MATVKQIIDITENVKGQQGKGDPVPPKRRRKPKYRKGYYGGALSNISVRTPWSRYEK